ncbi:hypothetical protein CBR_g37391 [Chara braunii]|uniref:Uncharacterized protein n=1 Tax=Chara braunii TaxID=69332 RepID=A0A388JZW0_CHABU|nr:hypothetical protein CBR_g37391 [Chara braunii]|eukprot:GBG63305.1 hypothetical protein CBR_g37391 [Chara braunii]
MEDARGNGEYGAAGEAVIEEPRVAEEGARGLVRIDGGGGAGGGGGGGGATRDGDSRRWVLGGGRGGADDCASARIQDGAASLNCRAGAGGGVGGGGATRDGDGRGWVLGGGRGGADDCASALIQDGAAPFNCRAPSKLPSSPFSSSSSEEEREEERKKFSFRNRRGYQNYRSQIGASSSSSSSSSSSLVRSSRDEDPGVARSQRAMADAGRNDQLRHDRCFGGRVPGPHVDCDGIPHDGDEDEDRREGSAWQATSNLGWESRSAAGTGSSRDRDRSRSHRLRGILPLLERYDGGRKTTGLPPRLPARAGPTSTPPGLAGGSRSPSERSSDGVMGRNIDNKARRSESSNNNREKNRADVELNACSSPACSLPLSTSSSSSSVANSYGSSSVASTSKSSDEGGWDCFDRSGGGGDQRLASGLRAVGEVYGRAPALPWAYVGGASRNNDEGLMAGTGGGMLNQGGAGEDRDGGCRRRSLLHSRSCGQMGVTVGGRGSGRVASRSGSTRGRSSASMEAELRNDGLAGEARDGGRGDGGAGGAAAPGVSSAGGLQPAAEGSARCSTNPMGMGGGAVASWVQTFQWQTVGACRMDERLRPLLRWNLSCVGADGQLLADLGQHFRAKEMMMLVRCLLAPLVSLRAGRVSRHGSMLCPASSRGYLSLIMLPCSELRLYFIADRGVVERVAVLTLGMERPGAELQMLQGDCSGRTFCIRLCSGRKVFFWNSEKCKTYGDDLISKLKDLLGHPPTLSQLTGIKDSRLEEFAAFVRTALLSSPNNNSNRNSNINSGGTSQATNLDLLGSSRLDSDGLTGEPITNDVADANVPDSGDALTRSEVEASGCSSGELLASPSFASSAHLRTTGACFSTERKNDQNGTQPDAQPSQLCLGQTSSITSQNSTPVSSPPRVPGFLSRPMSPSLALPLSPPNHPSVSLPSRLWHIPSLPLQLSPHLSPASQGHNSYPRCKGPSGTARRSLCSLNENLHQSHWQRPSGNLNVSPTEDGREHDTKDVHRYVDGYYGSQGWVDQESFSSMIPPQPRFQYVRPQAGVPMVEQKHCFSAFPLPSPRYHENCGGAMTSQGFRGFGEEPLQRGCLGGHYRNPVGQKHVAPVYGRDLGGGMGCAESTWEGPDWTELLSSVQRDSEGNSHRREIGVPVGGRSRPWVMNGNCVEGEVAGNRLLWAANGNQNGGGRERGEWRIGGEAGMRGSCCICGGLGGNGGPVASSQGMVSASSSPDPMFYSPNSRFFFLGAQKRDFCADCSSLMTKMMSDRAESCRQGGFVEQSSYFHSTAKNEGLIEACHPSSWDMQSPSVGNGERTTLGTGASTAFSVGKGSLLQGRNADACGYTTTTASDPVDRKHPSWHATGVSFGIAGSILLEHSSSSEPSAPSQMTLHHHQALSDVHKVSSLSSAGLQDGIGGSVSAVDMGTLRQPLPPACYPTLSSGCTAPPAPTPIGLPIGPSASSSVAQSSCLPPPLASLFPVPTFETPAPWVGSLSVGGAPPSQCTLGWQRYHQLHLPPVQKQHNQALGSFVQVPQPPTRERLPLSCSFFSLTSPPPPLAGPSSPPKGMGAIPLPGQAHMPLQPSTQAELLLNRCLVSADSILMDVDHGISPCHGSRSLPGEQFGGYLSLSSLPSSPPFSMSSSSSGIVQQQRCAQPGHVRSISTSGLSCVGEAGGGQGSGSRRDVVGRLGARDTLDASHNDSFAESRLRRWLGLDSLATLGNDSAVIGGGNVGRHVRSHLLPGECLQEGRNEAGMSSEEGIGPLSVESGMARLHDAAAALTHMSGVLSEGCMQASRAAEAVARRGSELPRRLIFSAGDDTTVYVGAPPKPRETNENGLELATGRCGWQGFDSTTALLIRGRANEAVSPFPSLLQSVRAPLRGRLAAHVHRMSSPPSIYRTREKEVPVDSPPSNLTVSPCTNFQPLLTCHIASPDGASVSGPEGAPAQGRDTGPFPDAPDVWMADMDSVKNVD